MQFCGDLWLPHGYHAVLPEWLIDGLVFNLEAPITTHDCHAEGKICLKTDPATFEAAFSGSKPLAACLANNHILDYGPKGFDDTVSALTSAGIPYFGAGKLNDSCNNPLLVSVNGVIVALLGYVCATTHPLVASNDVPGVMLMDRNAIATDVERARARGATRIVVCLHWGEEEVALPKPADVGMARWIIEQGVDVVVGHHAHCRQPIYDNGSQRVFFGLGNVLFPDFEYRVDGRLYAWGKQRRWNRRSTLVRFQPESNHVEWGTLCEADGIVSRLDGADHAPLWTTLPSDVGMDKYNRRFERTCKMASGRLALSRFIARPRVPSIESLAHVLSAVIRGR
jgi:poly-gamma-glutamate synthesis protein (capsule biosynthesis protein)